MITKFVYLLSKFHGFNKLIDRCVEIALHVALPSQQSWKKYLEEYSGSYLDFEPSQKFLNDPARFLKNMAIVLYSGNEEEKGVLLVAYNYAFPTLACIFDLDKITARYHIVLEPSTARYCMPDILMFKGRTENTFIQSGEERDSRFLNRFMPNARPVPIAANWWIDSRVFKPDDSVVKDIDVIMVSSWLKLKRHYLLFEAMQKLKAKNRIIKCVLVGYPIDMTKQDIIDLAVKYNIISQVTIYESLSQVEISRLYQRSKINLLLSKREGFNRSIIEGLHSGVPCFIRDGFNFGDTYNYINEETGGYFRDATLSKTIAEALDSYQSYSPNNWIVQNKMTAKAAAMNLEKAIYNTAIGKLEMKVSALDGMEYWDNNESQFKNDYQYLLNCSKSANS